MFDFLRNRVQKDEEGAKMWLPDNKDIEFTMKIGDAVDTVQDEEDFFQALFTKTFEEPLTKFQNNVFLSEKAYALDTPLRKIAAFQGWVTFGVIVLLWLLRIGNIAAMGYEGSKTAFDIGLTFQTSLFVVFCWLNSKVIAQNALRLSDERKRRRIAEAMTICHQGLLSCMDGSKFPRPTKK